MRGVGVTRFFNQVAVVETYLGTAGSGADLFSAPVTLDPATSTGCWIDNAIKLVRSPAGEQVVSNSRLYTYVGNAPLFTPDSRVTVGAVVARVIVANVNQSGLLGLPDHVAVELL